MIYENLDFQNGEHDEYEIDEDEVKFQEENEQNNYRIQDIKDIPEQLDYYKYSNYNFPNETPNPLIYQSNNITKKSKSNTKKKFVNKPKSSIPKPKTQNIKKVIPNNVNSGFNLNTNTGGLFDPSLKKNVLRSIPIATKLDNKNEKFEKAKNYNLKSKKKTENIQIYQKIEDVVEDLDNLKIQRNFNRKEKSANKITEDHSKTTNAIKYFSNNLDFNFDKQENIIKSLESQLEKERRMRAEMNMKLMQKARELEEINYKVSYNKLNITSTKKKLNSKVKSTISAYLKPRKLIWNNKSSKFKQALNKTMKIVKKSNDLKRSASENLLGKAKYSSSRPEINQYVEGNLNNLYREVLKSLDKKGKSLNTVNEDIIKHRERNTENSNILIQDNQNKIRTIQNDNPEEHIKTLSQNRNSQVQAILNPNEQTKFTNRTMGNYKNELNESKSTNKDGRNEEYFDNDFRRISKKNQEILNHNNKMLYSNFEDSKANIDYQKAENISINPLFYSINSNQIERKIVEEISQKNHNNMENLTKFELLKSLNEQVERYNQGLPKLIETTEKTLEKINQNQILDKKLHPVIKLASKHCGKQIHFHLEELSNQIIGDLVSECVEYLGFIDQQKKMDEKKIKLQSFVSKYSENFDLIKNIEKDVAEKIETKSNFLKSSNIVSTSKTLNHRLFDEDKFQRLDFNQMIIYENNSDPQNKENFEISNSKLGIYKNPFESKVKDIHQNNLIREIELDYNENIAKKEYSMKNLIINGNMIKLLENYKDNYYKFQLCTGVYFRENIFAKYEYTVEDIIKEIMEDELNKCLGDVDVFAQEIYHNEVNHTDNIKRNKNN